MARAARELSGQERETRAGLGQIYRLTAMTGTTSISTTDATETTPAPGTSTVTEPDIRPVTDDGDHDRFAHYTRRADANRAYVEGTPVRALCGKVWVPSRDPSRYPVCPECAKIRERLRRRVFN